jgi:hypothetical protein
MHAIPRLFWPQYVPGLRPSAYAPMELSASSGVCPATEALPDVVFSPGAYVPREPWHEVPLRDVSPVRDQPLCGVFKLPGYDPALWQRLTASQAMDPAILGDKLAAALVADLQLLFGKTGKIIIHGFNSNRGNERTVTIDHRKLWKVGLHIDTWEGGSLDQRQASMVRLCVNLGPGDRYFLFAPMTLVEIIDCLPVQLRETCRHNSTSLCNEFFARFPEVTIMRLLIKPGYGYFADTDNMIHDGSTSEIASENTHFTVRGRFGLLDGFRAALSRSAN